MAIMVRMTADKASLTSLLGGARLRSVYQPIVDLVTGAPVAYEALSRGPEGTDLEADDPLAREWVVAVIGPHFAGALVARDLGGEEVGPDRRFDSVITHDRTLAVATARMLMERVLPTT